MRNGFLVYDADTHVDPSAEVLDRHVDPSFRPRLPELVPYRVPAGRRANGETRFCYRVAERRSYRRVLGEAGPHASFTGRGTTWMGTAEPRPGILDDDADARVRDMDDEGTDVQLLVPGSWTGISALSDPGLEVGLVRAYHRHMADFCGAHPTRLEGMILASGRSVAESVREIRAWGTSRWAVGVRPLLADDAPVDHPDLEPIWRAAAEHDLPIVHHSSTWHPPYFPGHREVWDNVFVARCASHAWGAMRFVAAFVGSGVLDRHPTLRVGVLECGAGWIPYWARRMDQQAAYVGGTATLRRPPSEYLLGGRFFATIQYAEGEDLFRLVRPFLGDGVLLYASDYPHAECQFPSSVDNVLSWSSLEPETMRKLFWGNAQRCFKRT